MGWLLCRRLPNRALPLALRDLTTTTTTTTTTSSSSSNSNSKVHPAAHYRLDKDFWQQVPRCGGTALGMLVGERTRNNFWGAAATFYPLRGQFLRFMNMKAKVDRRKLAVHDLKLVRRRAKLRKAQMTEDELLSWRLQRAKRKAALLDQRLRKFELPDDPEPLHDPELITPEQHQALKKIGYKNRNYVPVGRRGVYGGVVQNMHMHWKKHETVQVDCQNYKRPVVKQMARDLARLSGGIVIDIHQGTLVIMYRGRNYRQPKEEMIPGNTLTKRKALFKSKYDQALEMVRANITNIENKLRIILRRNEREAAIAGVVLEENTSFALNNEEMEETKLRVSERTSAEEEYSEGQSEDVCDTNSDWESGSDSDSVGENDLPTRLQMEKTNSGDFEWSTTEDEHSKCREDIDETASDWDSEGTGSRSSSQLVAVQVSDSHKTSHGKGKQRALLKGYGQVDAGRSALENKMEGGTEVDMAAGKIQQDVQDASIEDELDYYSDLDELDNWKEMPEGKLGLEYSRGQTGLQKGPIKSSLKKKRGKKISACKGDVGFSDDEGYEKDETELELETLDDYDDEDFEDMDFPGTSTGAGSINSGKRKQQSRIHPNNIDGHSEDECQNDSNDGEKICEDSASSDINREIGCNRVAALKNRRQIAGVKGGRKKETDLWFGDDESDIDDELHEPERDWNRNKKENSCSKHERWGSRHRKIGREEWEGNNNKTSKKENLDKSVSYRSMK